ncbi:MAG TPA: ornithine cyclodeaminase family protein [Terriglobia bacterium]|nr:ornithine cyclodeaminase family protein [Terriglobia bacterium]
MTLFLSEADVQELFPMERALERVEASFRAQHQGQAVNRPRQRIILPHSSLHYLAASLPEENLVGMKIYTVSRQAFRFVVLLFDAESGAYLALMEADHLGRIRTGAASGVATKFLARPDASQVGMIGAGRQARTQLEAVARVRKLSGAKVFSRTQSSREEFCREMSAKLQLNVEPAASAEAAVRFADIVITATSSNQPLVRGEWLRPGTHVNAIGANMANRRELDDATLERAALIAVDDLAQSKVEAGDLIQGFAALQRGWETALELCQIVAGARPGRTSSDDVTIFKSSGIALWDVAAAGFIYRQALERGRGKPLALFEK